LTYRGQTLGRTPGEYLFLLGIGDSVVVRLEGYQSKTIHLDKLYDYGTELFLSLEPISADIGFDDLQTYHYTSPIRKVLSKDLLICLGAGAGLLAGGAHFNHQADRHYDRYLQLLGTEAREDAYSKARRNDRISKASFIAGDIAIGVFGYLLIRRFVFPSEKPETPGEKRPRLSVIAAPGKSGLSLRF
ncbi:MAG: hypothetical protein U9N45_07050, partial [Gemmatimonadota bacterium]|nr:hypothetical protein [Gemmatimonadota bacterium]